MSNELDERRAATRFEPEPDANAPSLDEAIRDSMTESNPDAARPTSTSSTPGQVEEESYTDRLLKAKRKAQQNKPPE